MIILQQYDHVAAVERDETKFTTHLMGYAPKQ